MYDTERRALHRLSPPALRFPASSTAAAEEPSPEHIAFLQALDLLPYALAFFDLSGRLLCANRMLRQLLKRASEGRRLEEEVLRLVRTLAEQLRAEGRTDGDASSDQVEELVAREVDSFEARYRLRGSRVGLDLFGCGASLLVTLDRVQPTSQPDDELRRRFRLTRAELRVARLLAEGRSNQGIAAELHISPHTARHHTQRILQKLGVRSRAAVGLKLSSLETDRYEK